MDITVFRRAVTSAGLLAFSMAVADPVAGPRFVELGHHLDSFYSAAAGRFAHADVDGDGIDDLIFSAYSQGSLLLVLGKKADATLGFKQADPIDEGQAVRTLAWQAEGVPHILLVGNNGLARDFSGWPLRQQRQLPIATGAVAAAVGDIDANGAAELVVLTSSSLLAYRLSDGHLLWSTPASNNVDLALAQLDADPALEIILGGGVPGRVLDAATRAIDWEYIDGFGPRIATGRFAAGGGTQWVAINGWASYSVYRAAPWSPLWSGTTSHDIGALAAGDIDSNGRDVILYGDGQWGGLHVIDPNTRLERFYISSSGYGSTAATAVDLDGDGRKEIAFTSAGNSPRDPIIVVADSTDGAVKWSYKPADGAYIASGIADVNGDGREEVVAASPSSQGNGTISIFDALTGETVWRSSSAYIGNANEPFYMSVKHVAFRDRAAGLGKDIVLAGTSSNSGRIIVLNGLTREVSLQVGFYSTGPMDSEGIKGLHLYDYNADGVDDFIVAVEALTTGTQGTRLRVLSGTDGTPLWTSVTMNTGFAQINGVLLADAPNGKQGKQLIAVLPGSLRSYSSETGLLNWTLSVQNSGAAYIANGVAGAEFIVYDENRMRFYDAADRSFLREMTMPTPLRSVVSLNGKVTQLIVAAAGKLLLVDGAIGQVLTETANLGPLPMSGATIATSPLGESTSLVAFGSSAAFYRHRIELTDRIFNSSFESL